VGSFVKSDDSVSYLVPEIRQNFSGIVACRMAVGEEEWLYSPPYLLPDFRQKFSGSAIDLTATSVKSDISTELVVVRPDASERNPFNDMGKGFSVAKSFSPRNAECQVLQNRKVPI
jgi:hypothetical protein